MGHAFGMRIGDLALMGQHDLARQGKPESIAMFASACERFEQVLAHMVRDGRPLVAYVDMQCIIGSVHRHDHGRRR